MPSTKTKLIIGWIIVFISFAVTSLWSYWGINEAFHEGWYSTSILQNVLLTFVQYLSIPLSFLALSVIALFCRKTGAALFFALGVFSLFFFDSPAGRFVIFVPLLLLALGFYFAEFTHKKAIATSLIAVPLFVIFVFGIPQLIRVEGRFNDNDFGTRAIIGNEVELTWAPQGPGFPLTGTDWLTARSNCAHLNEAGKNLAAEENVVWRLPTRNELVRSLTKSNNNAGGYIDDTGVAHYTTNPDKETPLWNPHSQIIYYWTNESASATAAYLVAYNGTILSRSKTSGADYQGYRCVKN